MMEDADYLRGVSFRFYQPHADAAPFHVMATRLRRFRLSLEILNTKLPSGGRNAREMV